MTTLQLVKEECPNLLPDSSCLCAMLDDAGRITKTATYPRCLLSDGERCAYFEECIAPMVKHITDPARLRAVQEAVDSYRRAHSGAGLRLVTVSFRSCPDCGTALPPWKRLCSACAEKRRKLTLRDAQRRRRFGEDALSTVKAEKA